MKLTKYEIVGIKKIYSEKKEKEYVFLNLLSVNELKESNTVGRDVAKIFGTGKEFIGDEIYCVTVDGKTVAVDIEEL